MLNPATALRKDARTGKASMEHRHFATIAAIINTQFGETPPWSAMDHLIIAKTFADELSETNPKFDRARFLRACGV